MQKFLNKKNIPTLVFISIELILWILIIFNFKFDFNAQTLIAFQYASVCVAVLASFVFVHKPKLLHIAFIAILIADFFLTLLRPQLIEAGVATFSITAVTYGIYIYLNQKDKVKLPHLIIRISLSVIAPIVMLFIPNTNAMMVISAFYGVNLILNVIFSFTLKKKDILLSVGLVCFLLCDLAIAGNALMNMDILPRGGIFIYKLFTAQIFNTCWLFYVPCLVCLIISFKLNIEQGK